GFTASSTNFFATLLTPERAVPRWILPSGVSLSIFAVVAFDWWASGVANTPWNRVLIAAIPLFIIRSLNIGISKKMIACGVWLLLFPMIYFLGAVANISGACSYNVTVHMENEDLSGNDVAPTAGGQILTNASRHLVYVPWARIKSLDLYPCQSRP